MAVHVGNVGYQKTIANIANTWPTGRMAMRARRATVGMLAPACVGIANIANNMAGGLAVSLL